jgi:hypothetical protein
MSHHSKEGITRHGNPHHRSFVYYLIASEAAKAKEENENKMPKITCFKLPSAPIRCSSSCLRFIKNRNIPDVDEDDYARSRAIDKELHRAKKNMKREVKLLLLGAGESGKSTFLKQMKIIHGHTFDPLVLDEYREVIYNNIIRGMKVLTDAREKLAIPWSDEGQYFLPLCSFSFTHCCSCQ